MYKHILLLMDCSGVDDVIVGHVADLASYHRSEVHLFHVIHAHTLDQRRVLSEKADTCLSRAMTVFETREIPAYYTTAEGEPAEQVLAVIQDGKYDLIAMATHGHKNWSDILFGSVSRELKHSVDIPLLMIKG